ncbi:MAG: hypothetical protein PW786_03305 [Arachidicoccus sp.]|nr:hypothetical protein [Arachidicoccus sp.]
MEIQLPDFVLADLYQDNIVIITDPKNSISAKEFLPKDNEIAESEKGVCSRKEKFWLGDNKKEVAIVVKDTANVFIDDGELQFLTNILNACKLNLSDVAIVNIAQTNLNNQEILFELNAKYFLLFGVEEKEIALAQSLNYFDIKSIGNTQFIKSPALKNLMQTSTEAKKEKAALWNALKKMFGL